MRKGWDREKKKWQKKRTMKIAVHYHCASQPPEQQPTGTATARANYFIVTNLPLLHNFLLDCRCAVITPKISPEIYRMLKLMSARLLYTVVQISSPKLLHLKLGRL